MVKAAAEAQSCAFVDCAEADTCALTGGCVNHRFAHVPRYTRGDTTRKGQRALLGTQPQPKRAPASRKKPIEKGDLF